MKQEQIEKEIDARLEEPDNDWDGIFNSGYSRGFREGAQWRINSVWHDASGKPKLGELIIVEVYGKIWDYGKYDVCDTIHPKARWAYMKDLIPNTEE